jgi:hypothetical protein
METWEQCDEVLRKEMHDKCKMDADLSSQLFNNYTISGVTDDGHSFEHNHQEPGYKEITIIDGKEVDDY